MSQSSITIPIVTSVPRYMHDFIRFAVTVDFDVIVPRISHYQSRYISPHSKMPIYQTDTFKSRRASSRKVKQKQRLEPERGLGK